MDAELEALLKSGKIPSDLEYDSDSSSSESLSIHDVKLEDNTPKENESTETSFLFANASEPYLGKTFESLEEAQNFYRDFAKKTGFETRIKNRRKSKKLGDWSSCLFECKKAGKGKDSETGASSSRIGKGGRRRDVLVPTGCKARLYVSFDREGKCWKVTSYEPHHNHEMVSPSKQNFMSAYRTVDETSRQMIDVLRKANFGPSKIHHVLQTQACGIEYLGFGRKEIENVIRDLRRAELGVNDAQQAIDYLNYLKEESGGQFFYRPKFNEENRLISLVWVDGRSRAAYKSFGDVITFDTTYRTNRYDMPFAPFTGVNHHYHSILFGFALLGDEKEDTFQWVLTTWLEAMDGMAPKTIITDQCQQIVDAVRKVFPTTHHGLCTWHISSKYPDKLNQVYKHHPTFKADYDRCVLKSLTIVDFEQRWKALMDKYNLHNHEWLKGLYGIRKQWIPAYTKRHFAAGMTTTARSEGMNHFFDQYVSSCTSLLDFIQKSVGDALDKQFFRERKEDFDCKYYSRKLECINPLEKHAAKVYTKAIFKRFQIELKKSGMFNLQRVKDGAADEQNRVYICRNEYTSSDRTLEKRMFTINFNKLSGELRCNCMLYEHLGILCRHLLRFLWNKNFSEIPNQYILPRWTLEANYGYNKGEGAERFDMSGSQTMRYNHLSQLLLGVAQEASCSKGAYKYVVSLFDREKENISAFPPDSLEGQQGKSTDNSLCSSPLEGEGIMEIQSDTEDQVEDNKYGTPSNVLDPNIVKRKGRKREKRLKRPIEDVKKHKGLRMCSICGFPTNHDKRNHAKMTGQTPANTSK